MNEIDRAFAACIGEVNNRYLDRDPPVIGAMNLAPNADYDFGVQFLMRTTADVARATEQGVLPHLSQSIEESLQKRNVTYDRTRLHVALSSLEAEGIRR